MSRALVISSCALILLAGGNAPRVLAAEDDAYLSQLLDDPDYGTLNRYIRTAVGDALAPRELGIKIGTLNGLASRAKMKQEQVLEVFKRAVEDARSRGLDAVVALDATSGSISYRLAQEEQRKHE